MTNFTIGLQQSFTKRLPGLNSLNYAQTLSVFGIDSLELRRLRNNMVFVYKMFLSVAHVNFGEYF